MFFIVFYFNLPLNIKNIASNINYFTMKYITHTPTRNDIKIWVALFLMIFIIPGYLGYYLEPENPIVLITSFAIIGFFIFNFVVRKSISFKGYFTHPFNFLTSKVYSEKTFDIPKELMFEKIVEVLNDSKFKLIESDKQLFEILAITSISFKSWGENLYISLDTSGNETRMKFCSVTLFQIYAWGKNEKNCDDLLEQIESSLTV